jgi:hypothetical protein
VNVTIPTAAEDPVAVSGHKYPQPAAIEAERYCWHLNMLRGSRTRVEAAKRTRGLATAAGRVAGALPAADQQAKGTWADPDAWTDLWACLTCMAVALERGTLIGPGWKALAATRTRAEFAAAWKSLAETLTREGTSLPGFATAQAQAAADATTSAPW